MPSFETRRAVPFTPDQMYNVVADIERYPQFLPLCEGLRILSREQTASMTKLIAVMDVGYKSLRESFKTKVELQPNEPRIDVAYLDGPFRYMQSRWRFHARDNGCEVDFFIDYEFRSKMLGLLMGAVFEKAFRKFSKSFEDRAAEIYANPSTARKTH